MKRAALALSVAVLLPAASLAQPAYRLGPDTLRYQQQIEVRLGMRAGDSVAVVINEVNAILATLLRPDGRGWYESLRLRQTMPGPVLNSPATTSLVRRPFRFSFTPQGRTTVFQRPAVTEDIVDVYDVRFQFDDFFITLPLEPLAVGVTWADTVLTARLEYSELRLRLENTRRYRVERDTLIGDLRAVVIRVAGTGTFTLSAPGVMGAGSLDGQLDAEETGFVVMTADGSRLLSRHRKGVAQGSLTAREGDRELVVWTRAEYRAAVTLQQRRPGVPASGTGTR